MQRRAAFVEVLDQILDAAAPPSGSAGPAAPWRPAPVLGFFDVRPYGPALSPRATRLAAARAAQAWPPAVNWQSDHAHPTADGPSHTARRLAPRRTLPARQQQALDSLLALGATLESDFTVEELRTAFRELARCYHPDRHPGSGDRERAHLTRLFTQMHDAYLQLQPAAVAQVEH